VNAFNPAPTPAGTPPFLKIVEPEIAAKFVGRTYAISFELTNAALNGVVISFPDCHAT
jgi:hypothetical protein